MVAEANTIELRAVCNSDRAAIDEMLARLINEAGPDYLPSAIEDWLSCDRTRMYIACDENDVVGLTATTFPSPGEAWLQGIRILPGHRRRGVGAELARYQVEQARAMGLNVMRLAVARDNEPAKRLVTDHLQFSRLRLWSVMSYPLTRAVPIGDRPVVATGPLRQDVLRFLQGRRYPLACAWPSPWVMYSYSHGLRRLTDSDLDEEWLLVWPLDSQSEPGMVGHIGVCEDGPERYVLIDLLVSTLSPGDTERLAADLLATAVDLGRGTGCDEVMFSLPTRTAVPVRNAARWLGLAADGHEWDWEIYQLRS